MMGGTLSQSEIINNTTLLEHAVLSIPTGKLLTVNGTYKIKQDINVSADASILTSSTGLIYFLEGAKITSANWGSSLWKSESGGKVRLYWSSYTEAFPGVSVSNYKIYRRIVPGSFVQIATVSGTTFEYIDNETAIVVGPNQSNETTAEYYIVPLLISGSSGLQSNTILYNRVAGGGMEKSKEDGISTQTFTYSLGQNYPNPFNGMTKIPYTIEKSGIVTLRVYDILGQLRAELFNGYHEPGVYTVDFDTKELSSGVYVYELSAYPGGKITNKLILTR